MHVYVTLYGAARVVAGQPVIDLPFDASAITLAEALEALVAAHPRARPYLLDTSGSLQPGIRLLLNGERPQPDVTPATTLYDGDRIALLVPMAGGSRSHCRPRADRKFPLTCEPSD